MRRSTAVCLLLLLGAWLQSCNEPSEPVQNQQPRPAPQGITPVHLAVGNLYNWRVTRIGMGAFYQWGEMSSITDDTVLAGRTFYLFDTGVLLSSSRDSVFAYSNGTMTLLYRLNVSIGDSVPFLGSGFRVTDVDTQTVLGEVQLAVSVSNAPTIASGIVSGRYASKFGVIRLEHADSPYVYKYVLCGARLGTTTYGLVP